VTPDAQHILDTLEENREWYHSMIPLTPTTEASSGRTSPTTNEDQNKTEERELSSAAEQIKFQITMDDPNQD
jgi:hypothetical protein